MSAERMHTNHNQRGKKKGSAGKPRARSASRSARPEELVAATPPANLPRSVVGIGASAGGLEAFTQLLRALPVDTGMAFVLVQHLSPTHQSVLAEILSRTTTMPVTEVADEPELEPNRVYVIPPDRNMIIVHGHLRLLPREALGKQHPIDRFFRSLAESQRHMAIGVVLSGTATDGTLGLEEIKAEGGITFAQDESAQQRGMPQSAVASGCVDFVLAPAAIAAEIARIGKHPYVAGRPSPEPDSEASDEPDSEANGQPGAEATLDKEPYGRVLQLLRTATGVDFAHYKTNTLLRRIRRRMVLQKKEDLPAYEGHLRESPAEQQALYQDILINVTTFFRDPEMFEALKRTTIPRLLAERGRHDPLRVWVSGCSTGEEAYSLAMILTEAQKGASGSAPAQVFATDLNATGIQRARAGVYSKDRMASVSRERLRTFFVEQNGEFRVAKAIRDMCVFSRHNLLADPPFSRMDLVSCRNLLIYLEPWLQQKVIPLLHYALKPKGFLVLGASETVGRFRDLFGVEDGKHKIFAKKPGPGRLPTLPVQRSQPRVPLEATRKLARPTVLGTRGAGLPPPGLADAHREADRLLASLAPPAVLVDEDFEIMQIRGNVEPFLVPGQGKATLALLKMAREGLLVPLQTLLQRAKKTRAPAREAGVRVKSGGEQHEVDLEVLPLERAGTDPSCFLVLFKDATAAPRSRSAQGARRRKGKGAEATSPSPGEEIARLEHELASTREYLQALMEQYEASSEELQSSNEEIQSSNEELQSINEELETSKEEIQSSNEELTTVNDELQSRNIEVGQLNNDLTNLISSVQLAIVIVGRDLRIRRFSPAAQTLLNVIAADVGRPINNIRMKVVVPELDKLLDEVIDTVSPRERAVQDQEGHWWSLRVRPYLTLENKIDGAVLMLVDIDALKQNEQDLAAARDYLRKWQQIFEHATWAVATMHPDSDVLDLVNPAFARMHGYTVAELLGRPLSELVVPAARKDFLELTERAAKEGSCIYESLHLRKDGTELPVLTQVTSLRDDAGRTLYQAATFQDITDRKQLEAVLQKRSDEFAAADTAKNQFISVLSHELRSPLNVILLWAHILRRPNCSADELRKGLEVIDQSSRAQAQLIEDLLDVHRISYGKVRLTLAPFDLGEITRSLIDSMMPAARERGIRVELALVDGPVPVSGDSARLQQVLRNLLDNALKFTPRGGRVRVGLLRKGGRAEVSLSDSGQGIAPEALTHIFERFRQPDPLRSAGHGGLGLGLSIAKHLVELHGGTISAQSPGSGKGATFTFSLPLAKATVASVRATEALPPVSLAGVLVLVVDDEPNQREPLGMVLEKAGAEIVSVASVDEALGALERGLPDVIVSDIGMPGRDGYDLLRTIRAMPAKRGGRIPAIALTAYVTSEDRVRALAAGFQTHLAKPVESAELITAVAAFARASREHTT